MALCSVAHPLLNVNICTAKPPKLSTSFSLRPIHPFLKCRQRAVSSMPRALLGEAGRRGYTSVLIVPTGVGAAIGGFAGDALPVARAMASVVDCLISHPNVLNAAMLYWPMPNALYVEGYALDRFAEGLWGLQAVHQNKIGLVLDAGIEDDLRVRHLQVADAARASLGLPVMEYVTTDVPLQVEKWVDAHTGQSTGRIGHPDSLLRAVDTLINCAGVNAVAVVGRFPDDNLDELEDYRQGKGVDILAGVEAIISHLVVKEFHIPCAHAPALLPLPLDSSLCPRSAAEEIGYTFLPSVLAGLSKAPQYVVKKEEYPGFVSRHGCLWADVVDSVVVPIDACGGSGILAFGKKVGYKPLIIGVEENETVLDDTPDKLGLNVLKVANYWEALGVIAAHKSGIDPKSLRRDGVKHIQFSSSMLQQNFIPDSGLQNSTVLH
ncbi:hypothetical protein SUGI_0109630 [Cryptomeria japonica]|uniref:uncharacterized protein LOC131070753 isoform X2 n=1 Tax=Cryptomeria japonica TaxID=3369 RepID=UPI002408DE64|nr:uncharacterized protein LOC131070753 isoform X2 [Cryptomeria japonica]GLJ09428.1 hypothetical protein SUGI_0109630 [Cryptomeria japonica]